MILVIYGPDELAIRRRLHGLREMADGASGMIASNLTMLEGREAKPEDIIAPAMAMPFLAPHRLIVVERFLERFESAGPPQRSARAVEAFGAMLNALAGGLPPTTMLVFTGVEKISKNNPMLDRLRKLPAAEVEELKELTKDSLWRFIRSEAAARSIRLKIGRSTRKLAPGDEWLRPTEQDPAVLLGELHGGNTLELANELDKLALFTMGREATVDDVDLLCGGERERTNFQFIDAVMDGEMAKAFSALEHLYIAAHGSTQGLLGLLASSYRLLATIVDLLEDGASPEEIGVAIKRPWPNLRDRAIARARRLGPAGLRAAYTAIVEADRTTKLGEVDEKLAMEILVHRLTALAAPARSIRA